MTVKDSSDRLRAVRAWVESTWASIPNPTLKKLSEIRTSIRYGGCSTPNIPTTNLSQEGAP